MVTYWSRIFARDLFEKKEINKLYEIVYLYGTYLCYKEMKMENDFLTYYKESRSRNRDCFINTANRKATEYFNNFFISATKMRRLIISSNQVVKRSYDWMPEYVNFILAECMNVDELKRIIVNDIFTDCERCRDIKDVDMYIFNCVKEILGFQYLLLDDIKNSHKKKSEGAKGCLERLKNIFISNKIIEECPHTNKQ